MFITSLNTVTNLPSPPLGLLPAVHDASITSITEPWTAPDVATVAGEVYQNNTGSSIILPERAGWPSVKVQNGRFFACDGRCFYEVVRGGEESTSFYPAHFERILFTVPITQRILPLNGTIRLERGFTFRLFNNVSNAVWRVFWEVGMRTSITGTNIGPNLEGFNWLPPMLDQEILITDIETYHGLGVIIQNKADAYIGTQLVYDRTIGAPEGSMPTTSDFVMRVRLGKFDTEDNVADPRGFVAYLAADANTTE